MIIKLNYPEYLIFTNCIDSNNLFPAAKVKVNPSPELQEDRTQGPVFECG